MFCKYCGNEIPDNAAFCPKCGQPTGNAPQPAGNMGQPQNISGSRPGMVMEVSKSPLMLFFTIILSVELVFGIIGYPFSVMNLLSIFVLAFLCLGCWVVYVNAAMNRPGKIGFSLLRIGVPIYLAIEVIGVIVATVLSASLVYGGVRAMVIIIYLVIIALFLWGFYGLFLTTNDGWKILGGADVEWRVRTAPLVILIILAVYVVIGTITEVVYYPYMTAAIAYIAAAAAYVVAIVILFAIRNKSMAMSGRRQ